MAKNPQSKDDSLEALDFIVNVLKEHEKDLDKLINELATVTEQLGETGDIGGKVEKVEEKITSLQKEVTNLMSYISGVGPKRSITDGSQRNATANDAGSFADTNANGRSFSDFKVQAMGRLPKLSVSSSNLIFQL